MGKHKHNERKTVNDDCEDIPIAELALEVPLQIICELQLNYSPTKQFTIILFFLQPQRDLINICLMNNTFRRRKVQRKARKIKNQNVSIWKVSPMTKVI